MERALNIRDLKIFEKWATPDSKIRNQEVT